MFPWNSTKNPTSLIILQQPQIVHNVFSECIAFSEQNAAQVENFSESKILI